MAILIEYVTYEYFSVFGQKKFGIFLSHKW